MTGYYPTSLSTDWLTPLDKRFPVLAERLQARGYLTGAFSGNLNYVSRETGLARGFSRFMDVRPTAKEMLLTVSLVQSDLARQARRAFYNHDVVGVVRALAKFHWARSTSTPTHDPKLSSDVTQQFLDWQRDARGRPWFGLLHMVDAHVPVKPKPPFDTLFRASGVTAGYDGAIATMDRDLGALWAELSRRGAFSRSIVIVTADHGELFGEHGFWEHGNSLYMPVIHVPLIIRAPGRVPLGVHVRQPVSLRDLGLTLLELVDRVASDEPELGGRSLRSTWDSGAREDPSAAASALTAMEWRRVEDSMQWRLTSLIADSMHYIREANGSESLFNVLRDPNERSSLTKTPLGRARAVDMRLQLGSVLEPER
jgi:arylsulfatase A-like enzyme